MIVLSKLFFIYKITVPRVYFLSRTWSSMKVIKHSFSLCNHIVSHSYFQRTIPPSLENVRVRSAQPPTPWKRWEIRLTSTTTANLSTARMQVSRQRPSRRRQVYLWANYPIHTLKRREYSTSTRHRIFRLAISFQWNVYRSRHTTANRLSRVSRKILFKLGIAGYNSTKWCEIFTSTDTCWIGFENPSKSAKIFHLSLAFELHCY